MIPFRKQREAIGRFLLKRKLKKQRRDVKMKPLSGISSAAIFFDASSEACRKESKALGKKLIANHVKVRSLGLFNSKNPELNFISDKNLYFATLKDFSFFFLPKSEEVTTFASETPDMLFIYSSQPSFPAQAVVEMSRPSLRVGFAHLWNNALDLTFEIHDLNPRELTKQIERYLDNMHVSEESN
ncbi:MAG: DUF6913 domain-containing protein [Marinilabiliaceae bacterium]